MAKIPAKDKADLVALARHVAGVDARYRGRVTLTLGNLLSHGSEESPGLELGLQRVAALCRKYLPVLSDLVCGDPKAYRYVGGYTFRTGAGLFGRQGGTHAGKSGYHDAHLFFSSSTATRPTGVPTVAELEARLADQ